MTLLTRRAIAAILDNSLVAAILIPWYLKFAEPGADGVLELHGWAAIVFVLFPLLYFPIAEGLTGQTLFKMAFGIKAVALRGREPSIWTSFKRHLIDPADYFLFGIVAIMTSRKSSLGQRLGDMVAKSVVVLENQEDEVSRPQQLETPQTPAEHVPQSGVQPGKPYALRRTLAFIIDYTVYFLLLFGTTALFGKTDPAGGKSLTGWLGFLSMFGWWFVVIILPEATLGYTLGKGTFSLRVISLKPNRPGWLVTIIRHIFDLIELCMFGGLVSVILIKTSALHQRIGDLAAGSTVVHDDR